MKELQTPPPAVVAPSPVVVEPPKVRERPPAPAAPSFEEQRRVLQAQAAPIRQAVTDQLVEEGFEDDEAWFQELERRFDAADAGQLTVSRVAEGQGLCLLRPLQTGLADFPHPAYPNSFATSHAQ